MHYRPVGVLVLLLLALLQAARADAAPPARRIPTLGVLNEGFRPSQAALRHSRFWHAMHELGWVEGQTITVERRSAEEEDDPERLRGLATELVQRPVDVILAAGPQAALAAKAASDTIPIVFTSVGDPVARGLVASLAHPGGNLTGLSTVAPELSAKRLEVLLEAAPGISRVAVLTNASVDALLAELTPTAQRWGVTLYPITVSSAAQLDHAGAALRTVRAEALLILNAALFNRQVRRVVQLAAPSRLPTLYPYSHYVAAGGLMSYGPSLAERDRRIATYVDKILKGAKPADLPVEQPMKFELVINLKTVKALGLTMPPPILFQADEVIR
jgi:putative ABC transport system substrate-binding protein